MWHYLCFIVLVKVKDSTEYTGPESYVAEMIKVRVRPRGRGAATRWGSSLCGALSPAGGGSALHTCASSRGASRSGRRAVPSSF